MIVNQDSVFGVSRHIPPKLIEEWKHLFSIDVYDTQDYDMSWIFGSEGALDNKY